MSKRQAGVQLTKDREEEEDWGRDGPPDPAEQATAEVLATRKIAMPKSRKRNGPAGTEESSAPNPFSFGSSSTTNQATKSNPFASMNPQGESKPAGSSNPFGSLDTSTGTPVFSFGVPTPKPAATEETGRSEKSTSDNNKTDVDASQASEDPEYTRLLEYRSINVSFVNAINASIANDAFADLRTICDEYKQHRIKATATEAAKTTNGTGIYPSFQFDSKNAKASVPSEETTQDSAKKSSFSQGPSTPAFTYPPNETANSAGALQTTFGGYGSLSEQAPASTAPKFTFGKSSNTDPAESPNNEDSEDFEKKAEDTSQKTTETQSKDFSWTPDRGIKFGESSKQTETKTDPPVFSFTNPMTSPSTTAEAKPAAEVAKPATFGFNFGGSSSSTGFSFGQSAAPAAAAPETKAPSAFTFNATAPTFTFGQSTTPTFSFSAPSKKEEKDESSSTTAAQEKGDGAAAEAEGDAMPDEPRTNDALIAGPGVGEEDEEEVYSVPRAKLFKYNSGAAEGSSPWSDLGIVVIRVLVHKETQKARIIARAEGAGALRLNARMYAHFKYSQEGKSNVKVYDLVSATQTDTYLVKMKEPKVATELTKTLNDHKS